jgi:hypothetical protein
MRLAKAFLAQAVPTALAAAALAGCGGSASGPDSGTQMPAVRGTTGTTAGTGVAATTGGNTSAGGSAPLAPSITPKVEAAARPAAAHFYSTLSSGKFAASWDLLAPAVRKQIPLRVWVGVHDACPTATVGKTRVIKAVTVFGNAAIVTTVLPGAAAKARVSEDVFNYVSGQWAYSPEDLSIYEHGSVAADVAAAKKAALCTGWKSF